MDDSSDGGIGQEIEKLKNSVADILERQKPKLRADARAIQEKIGGASMLLSARDARRMAANLHGILGDVCSPGRTGLPITRSAIVEKAGMADADGKSRPLYAYTLPPGLESEAGEKRKARIVRRPENYLKLTKAAAALGGHDEDSLVIRLVEGTSLAQGLADLPEDVQPDHLDMLTHALRGETRRIVSVLGLDWYFSKVDRQCLVEMGDEWLTNQSDPEFVAALPTVWLWTDELAEFEGIWEPRSADGTRMEPEPRTALICSRVGITIAPFGHDRGIVPCLFRRWATVLVGPRHEKPSIPPGNLSLLRLDLYPRILLPTPGGHGSDRIVGRRGVFRIADRKALARIIQSFERYNDDEFTEVTPSALAAALEERGPDVDCVDGDMLQCVPEAYTKAPPNTRMGRLEAALIYGCGDSPYPKATLGAHLEASAAPSVESLRRWVAAEETKIGAVLSRMASWGA